MHRANTVAEDKPGKQGKEVIKAEENASACSRTVSAHLSNEGNCQTCTMC